MNVRAESDDNCMDQGLLCRRVTEDTLFGTGTDCYLFSMHNRDSAMSSLSLQVASCVLYST